MAGQQLDRSQKLAGREECYQESVRYSKERALQASFMTNGEFDCFHLAT